MTNGPKGSPGDGGSDDLLDDDIYSEFDVEADDPLGAAFQDQIPTSYEMPPGQSPELEPIPDDAVPIAERPEGHPVESLPSYQEDSLSTATAKPQVPDHQRPISSFPTFDTQDDVDTIYHTGKTVDRPHEELPSLIPPEAELEDDVSTAIHDPVLDPLDGPTFTTETLDLGESPTQAAKLSPPQPPPLAPVPTADADGRLEPLNVPTSASTADGLGLDDPPTDPNALEPDGEQPWLSDEKTGAALDYVVEDEESLPPGYDVLDDDDLIAAEPVTGRRRVRPRPLGRPGRPPGRRADR